MPRVLADICIWVDYFRSGRGAAYDEMDSLLQRNQVVFCGIVELELLQGARPHERKVLEDVLDALDYVETRREDFVWAGERLCELRAKGIAIPATDALIAAICVRENLTLLTLDEHFRRLTQVKLMDLP